MKSLIIASLLIVSATTFAKPVAKSELITVETFEVVDSGLKMVGGSDVGGVTGAPGPIVVPADVPTGTPALERVGQVVAAAKDIVALGEAIYTLVQRGKPTNTTEYAPVSVVPRDPISKEYIDPFDLEGFSMPVQKKYTTVVKSGLKEAVRFEYMVMYSYGGSYNGVGKYITGVQIIPVSVKTSFGWDFTATMKVSGIMNHGTKADPVAGVMLIVKYSMNSWGTAQERNDTFHITGRGELKTFTN